MPSMKMLFYMTVASLVCSLSAAEETTIDLGLDYVRVSGEKWIERQGCVSCHQVPSMVWAHQAADESGLLKSSEQLAEWQAWSADYLNFVRPSQRADCDRQKTLASNIDTMAALLLAIPATDEAEWRAEFTEALIAEQASDGSWRACGQLPLQRRPESETHAVTTMWTSLALLNEGSQFDLEAAIDFADAIDTPQSAEWFAVRLLLAERMGDPRSDEYRERLLQHQNDDGGWGWLVAEASDALGTGYALYALRYSDTAPEPMTAAAEFLSQTQEPDGRWKVRGTKKTAKGPTATATDWGTAWAVLALATPAGSSYPTPQPLSDR